MDEPRIRGSDKKREEFSYKDSPASTIYYRGENWEGEAGGRKGHLSLPFVPCARPPPPQRRLSNNIFFSDASVKVAMIYVHTLYLLQIGKLSQFYLFQMLCK